jgi:peroxiredoxin family protein
MNPNHEVIRLANRRLADARDALSHARAMETTTLAELMERVEAVASAQASLDRLMTQWRKDARVTVDACQTSTTHPLAKAPQIAC